VSTIVVVRKNGSATIAADTLTTWEGSKDSAEYIVNHQKIFRSGDSYLAIAGPTSAKLAIKDYLANGSDWDFRSVDAIFRSWLKLHAALKKNYFLNADENGEASFESSRLDAVIANPQGIFGVAAHRAVQEFTKFYAYGSGSLHALGAMHALYADAARSAGDIARAGIEAAAAFDLNTGLPLTSYSMQLAESE
jgi:ATP-dependent HslUV protease, peptidase subunit HslV